MKRKVVYEFTPWERNILHAFLKEREEYRERMKAAERSVTALVMIAAGEENKDAIFDPEKLVLFVEEPEESD